MGVAEWIALAGVVAVLAFGIGGILATRRWGNRRRRLFLSCESSPMLPTASAEGRLQLTYRDFPVPDPHLVSIRLRNVGPKDVATRDFDAGASFRVELNCTMFGVIGSSHPPNTLSSSIGSDAVVEFTPGLLQSGDEWRVDVVVEGKPAPKLRSPLIDTDIVKDRVTRPV